jgi:hypothetical protein
MFVREPAAPSPRAIFAAAAARLLDATPPYDDLLRSSRAEGDAVLDAVLKAALNATGAGGAAGAKAQRSASGDVEVAGDADDNLTTSRAVDVDGDIGRPVRVGRGVDFSPYAAMHQRRLAACPCLSLESLPRRLVVYVLGALLVVDVLIGVTIVRAYVGLGASIGIAIGAFAVYAGATVVVSKKRFGDSTGGVPVPVKFLRVLLGPGGTCVAYAGLLGVVSPAPVILGDEPLSKGAGWIFGVVALVVMYAYLCRVLERGIRNVQPSEVTMA